jgi:hypothetical protein
MKRCAFNRGFFWGIAVLLAGNLAILALLLKPGPRQQQSASAESGVLEAIDTSNRAKRPQTKPDLSVAFRAELGSQLRGNEEIVRLNQQKDDSTSATIEPAVSSPEVSRLDYTAIGAVIKANGGMIPATGRDLQFTLQKIGDFSQLSIPFSAVALDSGLSHPRVVITQHPPHMQRSAEDPTKSQLTISKSDRDLIGGTSANQADLVGRLFLAANMEYEPQRVSARVTTVEFISWNSRLKKFEFGVIEGMGESPVIKFLDGIRCFSCHKNKGPILGNNPWSNTSHNDLIRDSSSSLFHFEFKDPWATGKKSKGDLRDDIDGMMVLTPRAAEVDAGVRAGADLIHNRKIFRALIQSPKGRDAFGLLLSAIVESGPLDSIDNRIKTRINNLDLARFLFEAAAINRTRMPSRLLDFNPAGPVGTVNSTGTWWGGTVDLVAVYDDNRAAGNHGMKATNVPSNPKAFFKLPLVNPNQPSDLISAVMLARTIGLTERDRVFLIQTLDSAAMSASRLRVTPAMIAKQVFDSRHFADILSSGELPDRDDFKDRFVAGLGEALQVNAIKIDFLPKRELYAIQPKQDSVGKFIEIESETIPTTSCLRCHDISKAGKKIEFNPIPLLAFDPFDKAQRGAWAATTEKTRKEVVLKRMLKRLSVDQDMPPEDSLEYKMFRHANPGSFEEAKHFLEAELKKAKGE